MINTASSNFHNSRIERAWFGIRGPRWEKMAAIFDDYLADAPNAPDQDKMQAMITRFISARNTRNTYRISDVQSAIGEHFARGLNPFATGARNIEDIVDWADMFRSADAADMTTPKELEVVAGDTSKFEEPQVTPTDLNLSHLVGVAMMELVAQGSDGRPDNILYLDRYRATPPPYIPSDVTNVASPRT